MCPLDNGDSAVKSKLWQLPVELQQKILSNLGGTSLFQVQGVCVLWDQLIQEVCRQRLTLARVPGDILENLRREMMMTREWWRPPHLSLEPFRHLPEAEAYEGEDILHPADPASIDSVRWSQLYTGWLQCQVRMGGRARVFYSHALPVSVAAVFADGPLLYLVDTRGVLTVLQCHRGEKPYYVDEKSHSSALLHDCAVHQIEPLWRWRMLLVCGRQLHFVRVLSQHAHSPAVFELMCADDMAACSGGDSCVSVLDDRVAVMPDHWQRARLRVLRVVHVTARWVHCQPLYNVQCPAPAYHWLLTEQGLCTFHDSGQVCVWQSEGDGWRQHEQCYPEMERRNPAWRVRHHILAPCDSMTRPQATTAAWADRPTYWLQGEVDGSLMRRHPLPDGQVVSCITWRRSLVAAGTAAGRILLFDCTSSEQSRADWLMQRPICVIELGFNTIEQVQLGFTSNKLLVFAVTKKFVVDCVAVDLRSSAA